MRALLPLAALLAPALHAQEVRPTADVRITTVEVIWVDTRATMRELLVEHGVTMEGGAERGFSLRGKHAVTGVDVCIIYAFRPETMNDRATLVLGHELTHCFFGAYHN